MAVERLVQGLKVADVMLRDYPVVTQNLTLDTLRAADGSGRGGLLPGRPAGQPDRRGRPGAPSGACRAGAGSRPASPDVMKRLEALVTVTELDPLWDAVSALRCLPGRGAARGRIPPTPTTSWASSHATASSARCACGARPRRAAAARPTDGRGGRPRPAPLLRLEVALERMLAGVAPLPGRGDRAGGGARAGAGRAGSTARRHAAAVGQLGDGRVRGAERRRGRCDARAAGAS